jgi:hydroxypyruvate reductase
MAEAIGSAALHFRPDKVTDRPDAMARRVLREMFNAAVASADPANVLADHLPPRPKGRCVVVGAGKAAGAMAAALEKAWPHAPLSGVVAVPYGYGVACHNIRVIEAGHPLPDGNSLAAAKEALKCVAGLSSGDLVIALISGGGSAAMCLPMPGLTLQDKQLTNRLLLSSGLDIRSMNAVRRRISGIKGGKLAVAAAPATVVTLAISDIPGDDYSSIASGPTVRDPSYAMALDEIAERLGPRLPGAVAELLRRPAEPVCPDNAEDFRLIATPGQALAAAAAVASTYGIECQLLGDDIEGESREIARDMARQVRSHHMPVVLISGGETTVTLGDRAGGRGGRNTEFALSLACELAGHSRVWALACDSDGEDGANLGAAGAIITPDTLERAAAMGLDAVAMLDAHDSGSFFAALGDLVLTGPTLTNVNDFRAILVLPDEFSNWR